MSRLQLAQCSIDTVSAVDLDPVKDGLLTEANDSGYVSRTGTGHTTPNSKIVQPQTPPHSSGGPILFNLPTRGFRKRDKVVPFLDKEVDEPTKLRFQDVKPHFDKLLLEHVLQSSKPGTRYTPISTRLIMMGTRSENASAYIIVFCQPEQKDTIRRFVRGANIQTLCGVGDDGVPPLKIAVSDIAPRLRLAVDVMIDASQEAMAGSQKTTLCGTPIQLKHSSGMKRNATFGGFVKILTDKGEIRIFGITAAHPVLELDVEKRSMASDLQASEKCSNDSKVHVASTLDRMGLELASSELEDDGSAEERPHCSDEDDDEDISLDCFIQQDGPQRTLQPDGKTWIFQTPCSIGSIIYPKFPQQSSACDSKRQCYDWALFETFNYEANKLSVEPKATITLSDKMPGATGTRPIYLISASGVKEGQLSPCSGSIVLDFGTEFVDTYLVTMTGEQGVCDGDSGAWVVDRNSHKLYGHLVATDVLGGGYVIPMARIFDDIRLHLNAAAVELPDNIDILHCRTIATESRNQEFRLRPEAPVFSPLQPPASVPMGLFDHHSECCPATYGTVESARWPRNEAAPQALEPQFFRPNDNHHGTHAVLENSNAKLAADVHPMFQPATTPHDRSQQPPAYQVHCPNHSASKAPIHDSAYGSSQTTPSYTPKRNNSPLQTRKVAPCNNSLSQHLSQIVDSGYASRSSSIVCRYADPRLNVE